MRLIQNQHPVNLHEHCIRSSTIGDKIQSQNAYKSRMSKKPSQGQILILNFPKIQRKMILIDPIIEYKQRQFIFSSYRDFKMNGKKKNIEARDSIEQYLFDEEVMGDNAQL